MAGFKKVINLSGTAPLIREFTESNAVAYVAGDLVALTAGLVTLAAAANSTTLLGVCMETKTGVTGATIKVDITPGNIFECLYTGTVDAGCVCGVATLDIVDEDTVNAADITGGGLTLLKIDTTAVTVQVKITSPIFGG